jgi:hypothetical protein
MADHFDQARKHALAVGNCVRRRVDSPKAYACQSLKAASGADKCRGKGGKNRFPHGVFADLTPFCRE